MLRAVLAIERDFHDQGGGTTRVLIFYPKFHRELNFIERFRCDSKFYVRQRGITLCNLEPQRRLSQFKLFFHVSNLARREPSTGALSDGSAFDPKVSDISVECIIADLQTTKRVS